MTTSLAAPPLPRVHSVRKANTMKKTIAIIGSAAAFSFAGAGIATAQDATDTTPDTGTAPETTETTTDAGEAGDAQDDSAQDEGTDGTEGAEGTAEGDDDEVDTPEEVSLIAQQLCGTVSAYDFLGSAGAVAPGLSGEECEANADEAVETAQNGDIAGALDILRGIEAETPGDDETEIGDATGSTEMLESLGGAGEDAGDGATDADTDTDDAGEAAGDETGDDSTDTVDDAVSQAGA